MRVCPRCGARYTGEARFCSHDGEPTQELLPSDTGDPLLGTVVDGRYRIDARLGEGGMGVVYGVTHVSLGKRFALKVLRRDYARDETVVERFVREARAASSIGHPSIVDIHDFGRLPDASTYFVMELLEGETLTARIRRGALAPEETLHVVRQIASALSAAHASGIVHRDLKPDNVHLVTRGDDALTVKVLDFGIAKVGGAHGKLTRTGTVFGTPYYMSPEQAAGQSVDGRTDVYALGVIAFEMLTGHVPFDGDTFMGILSKQMFEAPPSLVASG
ncbi:MAG: protein kinase, partial [Myxococcota bacterium]